MKHGLFLTLIFALGSTISVPAMSQTGDFTLQAATDYSQRADSIPNPWLLPSVEVWAQDAKHTLPYFPDLSPYIKFGWAGDWNIQGPSAPFEDQRYTLETGGKSTGDYWGPFTTFSAYVRHQSTGKGDADSRGWNWYGAGATIARSDSAFGLSLDVHGIFKVESSMKDPLSDIQNFAGKDIGGSIHGWAKVLDYGTLEGSYGDLDNADLTFHPDAHIGILDIVIWGHHGPDRTLKDIAQRVTSGGLGVQLKLSDLLARGQTK